MHLHSLKEKVKTRREVLNVTQEQLAEIAGVGLRTLKQFESGKGNSLYSTACLKKVFSGKKISPFLNYSSSISGEGTFELFKNNRKRISISGVQEKFYIIQEKTT